MRTTHGTFFEYLERFWFNLRMFCYNNSSILEIMFIFMYAIEQVLLVWFTFTIRNADQLAFIVALFAIIVLTTFALQKLIMESRIKLLETDLNDAVFEKLMLESKTRDIIKKYGELLQINEEISKGLNKK